tara:strand:- start:399 stop:641 length:243 start_codon:yes stop_codon:yes gene_type:complete
LDLLTFHASAALGTANRILQCPMCRPTRRDKRAEINNTPAIQHSSPQGQNDMPSELRLVLLPIIHLVGHSAQARMQRQSP